METMMILLLEGMSLQFPLFWMRLMLCRVTESLCRSLNNLLEHLHQSFFFYFILSPGGKLLGESGRFVSIGTYLPAAMILAASFTLTAIALWIRSTDSAPRDSHSMISGTNSHSIGFAIGIVATLHGLGYGILVSFDLIKRPESRLAVWSLQSNNADCMIPVYVLCHSLRLIEIAITLIIGRIQLSRT